VSFPTIQVGPFTIFNQPFPLVPTINLAGRGIAKLLVTIEQDEDGFIVVSCPALPGCHSQGRTKDEAIANIKEAIRGYIASMRKHGGPIPSITDVEEVEVAV
jgi:predicted RNase H-like HicB family nuclease